MSEFEDHYIPWRCSRIAGLEKYFDVSLLQNKSLLEVGCGHADLGVYFRDNYKCKVAVSDARKEHLGVVIARYPDIAAFPFDCDNDKLTTKYDAILHWGVLYHISNVEKHLKNICESCDYLLLETEVLDSTDENEIVYTDESGFDQAYNTKGCRPSPSYVERLLAANEFEFKIITDEILNASIHSYAWTHSNNKTYGHGLRRFWIAWRTGVPSPLKQL